MQDGTCKRQSMQAASGERGQFCPCATSPFLECQRCLCDNFATTTGCKVINFFLLTISYLNKLSHNTGRHQSKPATEAKYPILQHCHFSMPYVSCLMITVKYTLWSWFFNVVKLLLRPLWGAHAWNLRERKLDSVVCFALQVVRLQAVLRSQLWTSLAPEARALHTDQAQMPAALVLICSDQPPRKKPKLTNQNKPQLLLWDKLKSFPFVSTSHLLFRVLPYHPAPLSNIFFFLGTDLHEKGKKLMPGIIHPVQRSMWEHWPRYLCCSSLCPVPPVAYFLFRMFFNNCPDSTLLLIES